MNRTASIYDPVLTVKLRIQMTFTNQITLAISKKFIKEKVKGLEKDSHEYANFIKVGNAIHALDKLLEYVEEERKILNFTLFRAVDAGFITPEASEFILSHLSKELINLKESIDQKFKKPQPAIKNEPEPKTTSTIL